MNSKTVMIYLILIGLIAISMTLKVQAEVTTSVSSTSTTSPQFIIINGTTSTVFVVCTTTILPLWENTTTIVYTTTIQPTQCYTSLSAIGFDCLNPVYSATTGNLTVEIAEGISSENWTNVYIAFVPKGTKVYNGIPTNLSFNASDAARIGVLHTGYGYNVMIPISAPGTSTGTQKSGSIWMKYMVQGNSTPQYVQVTTINMTAVSTFIISGTTSSSILPESISQSTVNASTSTTPSTSVTPTSTILESTTSQQNSNNAISSFISSIISFLKKLF